MTTKKWPIAVITIAVVMGSCIKDTYDMNRLSEKMLINPTMVLAAGNGDVTLADLIKSNDTIGFDESRLLRLWIRKDSVVDLCLDSLIDLSETFSFNKSYAVGPLGMGDIAIGFTHTLNAISMGFDPALRAQFLSLDDGSPHLFPSFPATAPTTHNLGSFTGFENVILGEGVISVKVTNTLPAPITSVRVLLRNGDDNSAIGTYVDIPLLNAGVSYTATIDLAGQRLYHAIRAEITVGACPGTASPVMVRMSDYLDFDISGTDMKATEGRLIIPGQYLSDGDDEEMISFDPGDGMEITEVKLREGVIDYTITSELPVSAALSFTLPTVTRNGAVFSESISVPPLTTVTGTFAADNMVALFNSNSTQPYNSMPALHEIHVSSGGSMVNFSADDSVRFEARISNLDIDFVKGFFGEKEEIIESDTIDLDIQELLDRISGEFYFADPRLTLTYSNSFGLPVGINLDARGQKGHQTVDLYADPLVLQYPVFPVRSVDAGYTVDKSNSALPELISLPPASIIIGGSARLNPSGNTGSRDNYIFGDSRFVAGVEALVPVDFWVRNLQLADTIDNFMKSEGDDGDFSPDDLGYLCLDFSFTNGFPLALSVSIILYDSISGTNLHELNINELIDAAPVDANGRVTTPKEKKTRVEFKKEFFNAATVADKMILKFTLNTTGSGSQSVKVYSDYSISFRVGVVVRPEFIVN